MNFKFEKVSRFKDIDLELPCRKTKGSAGYDFVVAEDIIIPPYNELMANLDFQVFNQCEEKVIYSLQEMEKFTKSAKARPTLIPTGVKAYMPEGFYLELSVRSSCPLKYWIIMANGEGIIDSDYADNPANEGEIFFQVINLSPVPIKLQKGETIGQGIFKRYYVVDDDKSTASRVGGFGSTNG